MSKNVKDHLFELIKSLSKSEKRYFKLISSRHTIGEVNNYIVLFDYIDKLDSYDEEALFEHFKGESFLNRYSITKKRLYDHILSALDAYYSSSSIDAQLFKQLHGAEILYKKSLYSHADRLLNSARKLAAKYERTNVLLEIGRIQKKLIENSGYNDVSQEQLEKIANSDNEQLTANTNYSRLWVLKSKLFTALAQQGVSRSDEERKFFDAIFDEVIRSFNPKKISKDSAYLYYHILSAYYFATNQFEKCKEALQTNVALFEKNKSFLEQHPNSYFSALTNVIYVSERLGNYSESNLYLQKLKNLPHDYQLEDNEDFQIKLFSSTSSIELATYIKRGDFESAEGLIPVIENGLIKYGSKISAQRRAFFAYKFAGVYMGLGDFSSALKWVNSILNDNDLDDTGDIFACAHLLDLLIHLELKHDQLLPYAIKSTQRFLKSRNRMHDFEKVMLHFIGKINKSSDVFEDENLWSDLHKELLGIKEDVYQSVALEYFDFESWAKSKINRKSFEKVVKEKFVQLTMH